MPAHRPRTLLVFAVLLLFLVPQVPLPAVAETGTLSTFKDGTLVAGVDFPEGGGWNNSTPIVIPAGSSVSSARLELAPVAGEETGRFFADAAALLTSSPSENVQLKNGALTLAESGWWWQAEGAELAESGLNKTARSADGIRLGPAPFGMWAPEGFAPVARFDHTAVWGDRDGQMIVYGGWNLVGPQPSTVDLYSSRNATWTQKASGVPQRSDHSAVWDDLDGLMLVFGGSSGPVLNELWAYNPSNNTWARRAAGPAARAGHSAVWDSARARMLVFGGNAGNQYFSDLWAYYPANGSWAPLGNYTAPALSQHSAVYDTGGDRMVVFGGLNDTNAPQNGTWTYDSSTDAWSQNANGPAPRQMHSAVFDPMNRAMLVYGGNGAGGAQNDLWAYNASRDRWTRLMSGGSVRGRQSAVWATEEAGMLILGGWSQFYNGSDLWSYRLLFRANGSASSPYIYPGAQRNGTLWVNLSIPEGTAYSIDLISDSAQNGTVAKGLQNGDRFEIPEDCPSIRLVIRMSSLDANLTPVLHGWGVGTRYLESFESPAGGIASGTEADKGLVLKSGRTAVWEQVAKGPSPRNGATAVWDADNGQLLVFGGVNGTTYFSELWAYLPQKNVWLRKTTGPSARAFHSAVWDPDDSTMIIFGGMNPTYQRDVWAYSPVLDGWTWKGLASIGNRARHCAVWDNSSHIMLVFGGSTQPSGAGQYSNALSAYDPTSNTWTPRATVNNGRHSASVAWDPLDHRMLVLGGRGPTGARQNDLWSYCPMNDTWELRDTPLAARDLHSACWNPLTGDMLVAGGELPGATAEAWSYSYRTNTWTPAPVLPGARSALALATDERGKAVLAFGGMDGSSKDECWMLTGTELGWTIGATTPGPRTGHTAVWDTSGSRMLVFGGASSVGGGGISDELWAYEPTLDSWTGRSSGATPRVNHSAAWDDRSLQMLVFGGNDGTRDLSDLWAYSPRNDSWTGLSAGPPARSGASAVWCTGLGQMLLFGGFNASTRTARPDLWAYMPSTGQWVRRQDSPAALAWHSAVWDERYERMLVFGGSTFVCATEYLSNSLWAYYPNGGQWVLLGTGASARRAAAAAFDPGSSRLLVLGGQNNTTRLDGLWACSLPGGTWTLTPDGPAPRSGASAVWDSRSGRGYFFGGQNGTGALDEVWSWGRSYDIVGSYLSPVRDLGWPASVGPARLSSRVPEGTSLSVFIRSSQNNSTWSQWEQLGPSGGPVTTQPQRYFQWRASLSASQGTFTPVLRSFAVEYTRYAPAGSAGPAMADPGGSLTRASVKLNATLNNGTAIVSLSSDGGVTWVDAPDGAEVSFPSSGNELAVRVRLGASPDGASSAVRWLSVDYWYQSFPTGVILRAGNGTLSAGDIRSNLSLDIAGLLNRFLSESPVAFGPVEIPLEWYSATKGAMVLRGLDVIYTFNHPPSVRLSGPTDGASFHAATVRLSWSASDADGDNVSALVRWSDRPFAEGSPSLVPVNGSSLELTGLAMNKTYFWTVSVSDGAFGVDAAEVRRFSTVNRAPDIHGVPPTSAIVGRELIYSMNATDGDNDPLAHHLVTPIAGMTLDVATGELRWTPVGSQKGNQTVSVLVSDLFGAWARQQFTLVVSDRYIPALCGIDRPAEGARAPRLLRVSGWALPGALDVIKVEVRVDSGRWANATGTLEWTFTVDTSKLRDGRHVIEARAYDGTAFSEGASVNISVQNSSPVTFSETPLALAIGTLVLGVVLAAAAVLVGRRRRAKAPPDAQFPAAKGSAAPDGAPPAASAGTSLLSQAAYEVQPSPARSLIKVTAVPSIFGGIVEKEAAFLNAVGDETAAGAVVAAPNGPDLAAPGRGPGGDFLVEDVFLMYKDGRLIQHSTRRIKADLDLEVVTSMLRAVQIFVRESLGLGEMSELGAMEYGENKIVLQKGGHTILAVVVVGAEPAGFRSEMRGVINDIEGEFGALLDGWNGTTGPLAGAKKFLSRLGSYHVPETTFERIHHDVQVQSELEFYQGFVRVKIAVRNKMPTVIRRTALRVMFSESSLRLDHIEPEYAVEGREILLGDIEPREKKTVALYLDPQICSESHLEGLLVFMDAAGRLDAVKLPRKLVSVVCPILFTEQNINVAMLKRMIVGELDKKDSKVFALPADVCAADAFFIGKAAVEHHDLKLVRELVEPEPYLAEAWYFGNVKGREDRLVARVRSLGERRVLEFHVASTSTLLVTGLLAELKTDLNHELEQRKLRDQLVQVTGAEQVASIRQIRSLLDKAAESEGVPGETEAGSKGRVGPDMGGTGGHELLRP